MGWVGVVIAIIYISALMLLDDYICKNYVINKAFCNKNNSVDHSFVDAAMFLSQNE